VWEQTIEFWRASGGTSRCGMWERWQGQAMWVGDVRNMRRVGKVENTGTLGKLGQCDKYGKGTGRQLGQYK